MLLCTQLLNLLVKIGIFLFSICGKRINKYVNNHTENSPKEAMTTFCCDIYKDFFFIYVWDQQDFLTVYHRFPALLCYYC